MQEEIVSDIFRTCLEINNKSGQCCSMMLFGETRGMDISISKTGSRKPFFEIRMHYGDGYNADGLLMLRDTLRQFA